MRDVTAELKALRLYGMTSAWQDLTANGGAATLDSSRWLIEHLLLSLSKRTSRHESSRIVRSSKNPR